MDNDYELLYLAKEDIDTVGELLYYKYKGLIYMKCMKYSSSSTMTEDFINESKIALYEAIENYQDNYKFSTYLGNCLDNHLSNYNKNINRNKHKLLNEAVSLDDITEINIDNNISNPEVQFFEEYNYNELKRKIKEKLTWKEELVFNLMEANYTSKEISQITDNSLRTVYNIINRIKNKVSNIVSN